MKKKRIFCLIPLAGMLLSGCSFADGWNWFNKSVYTPVVSFFKDLFGIKDKGEGDEEEKDVKATSILSVETDAWIEQNDVLDISRVFIEVEYSDGSTKYTNPISVELDTSTVANGVIGTAKFKSLEKTFSIDVVGAYEKATITSLSLAEDLDGYSSWKQLEVDGLFYDFMGVSQVAPIKIKQTRYADGYEYKGMVYNRSMLNGFKSIKVSYTGSPLYINFSEYLMEDMSFVEDNINKLPSDVEIKLPEEGIGFFVLYTSGEVQINSIDIKKDDVHDLDASLIYDENTKMNSARSSAKGYDYENKPSPAHDLINLENNPLANTNCYSTGTHSGNKDTWYRWNGVSMPAAELESNEFSVHTTIIGNISNVIDPSKKFNYSVWPQFRQPSTSMYVNDVGWGYAYMGDDNYDPNGTKNTEQDAHAKYSYRGRFFTRYDEDLFDDNLYEFADPDTHTTLDEGSEITLREAYEANKLPFWHVEFKVKDGCYETYINGFFVDQGELFYDYNENENINLNRMELHLVNYGDDAGNPADSYKGTFTTPRIEYK